MNKINTISVKKIKKAKVGAFIHQDGHGRSNSYKGAAGDNYQQQITPELIPTCLYIKQQQEKPNANTDG